MNSGPRVPEQQRRVLRIVLWINVALFLVELVAGLMAWHCWRTPWDMLGDAIVYGFSLYVLARGSTWQARAAFLEGVILAVFGLGVPAALEVARHRTGDARGKVIAAL